MSGMLNMSGYSEEYDHTPAQHGWGTSSWVGWIAFAGIMMVMLGTFHIIDGIVAIADDKYFSARSSELVIHVSYDTWGWAHIIIGIIVLLAGIGVFAGRLWARIVGVLVALGSALVNLAFLSAYPIWSVMMITLCIVVIMALTVHGSEINPNAEPK